MKNIVFAVLLLITNTIAIAGNTDPEAKYSIKGQVTDEKGDPLAGVEVFVEGLDKKVYTDFDGNFEVNQLKSGTYTLKFSYVAYNEAKNVFKTIQSNPELTVVKLQKRKLKLG
ncbi:MAG: carboxypeptidase-like regulatory domain-containing protein [Bacteroidetes bacterium]|nr:MAG: carboxypeptidase-like regulatory domain-containing protein [Bacteroidota bacterium]